MARHLRACGRCENRFNDLRTLLKTMSEVAGDGFEETFTPSRLQAQRARIRQRLAHLVGKVEPARVLAFPFSGRPFRRLDFPSSRWLAAAAVAGLLLGVAAGQLIHYGLAASGTATTGETADDAPRSAADLGRPVGMLDMTGTVQLPTPDGDDWTAASPLTLDEFERVIAEEEFLGDLDLALTSIPVSELESIDALTPRVRELFIDIR